MLYSILIFVFFIWSIWAIRKAHMSWHTIIGIYVVTLFIVDLGDVSFDYWFNFYDLPAKLLKNPASDHYLGIVFSDGILFPLLAIIFCSYSVRFNQPWLISIVSGVFLGILEVIFVKLGYMVYHNWNHWLTPLISIGWFRVLAHFSNRFLYHSKPIPYWFRLVCFTYVISEWPGAIMGSGVLLFYRWRLNIFNDITADDRLVAMTVATTMGVIAAIFLPKVKQQYKILVLSGQGLASALIVIWAQINGWMIYEYWNHFATFIRYVAPYTIVYLYDKWESPYTKRFSSYLYLEKRY